MSDIYKYDTDEILSPDEEVIHDQNKTIERLQEQLTEANEIIKGFSKLYEVYPDGNGIIVFNVVKPPSLENYIKKWSVK